MNVAKTRNGRDDVHDAVLKIWWRFAVAVKLNDRKKNRNSVINTAQIAKTRLIILSTEQSVLNPSGPFIQILVGQLMPLWSLDIHETQASMTGQSQIIYSQNNWNVLRG